MKHVSSEKGTTLIEVMVYISLLAFFIIGSVSAAYLVFASSSRVQQKILQEEEANFLLRKIEWALSNVTAVNSPTGTASSTLLSVDKSGFTGNPVKIEFTASSSVIKIGATSTVLLHEAVVVENGFFKYTAASAGSPASVSTSFDIGDITYEGVTYIH